MHSRSVSCRTMASAALVRWVVAVALGPGSSAQAQITWNVTYEDVIASSGFGFNDPAQGTARRAVVDRVIQYLNTVLDGRGTTDLIFRASENDPGSATLGSFGPAGIPQGNNGWFYNGQVYQRIMTGARPFDGPDGSGMFNFGQVWHTDVAPVVPEANDMFSVALHEIAHGLGFLAGVKQNGSGSADRPVGIPDGYGVMASFLQRGNGAGAQPLFNTNITSANFGALVGPVATLIAENDPTNGLFYAGKYGMEIFGGPVPMFAPTMWSEGSSDGSHTNTNPIGVMHPSLTVGMQGREFLPYEIGMLIDMGYNQFHWNNTTGNWADGTAPLALAASRWVTPRGITLGGDQQTGYNTNANPAPAPIFAPVGRTTSNIVLSFGGAGDTGYVATNDLGPDAATPVRLARIELKSTATVANTITGGHLLFGRNSDGSNSVLAPRIEQLTSGAFAIASSIQIPIGLSVSGTGTGDVTLTGPVSGAGALTKDGAGFRMLLNGPTNSLTFTGGVNVNGGTVVFGTNYAGTVNVNPNGTLQGAGTIGRLVNNGGRVEPGNSPGSLISLETVLDDGYYEWQIDTLPQQGGTAGGFDGWDLWEMNELTLIDESFYIDLLPLDADGDLGAMPGWDPTQEYEFLIATVTNGIFDDELTDFLLDESLFLQYHDLAGGAFSLSATPDGNQLFLNFAPAAKLLPGDYNDDGIVDAVDYVVWRDNEGQEFVLPNDPLGGTIGPVHYDQWRANFGQNSVTLGSGTAVVPEPASGVLMLIGGAAHVLRRRWGHERRRFV